jgi:TRAP-type C4-dicarboxylate transport system permease small subunit
MKLRRTLAIFACAFYVFAFALFFIMTLDMGLAMLQDLEHTQLFGLHSELPVLLFLLCMIGFAVIGIAGFWSLTSTPEEREPELTEEERRLEQELNAYESMYM